MSRILVDGQYDSKGAFIMKIVKDCEYCNEKEGDVFKKISPNEIFGVGNSIGGYWAKPIKYAGKKMIALVRLSGAQKGCSLSEIRRELGREKGQVLHPGKGLWATSSGSARNGVLHRYHPPRDVIEKALEKGGYGRRCIHRVPEIKEVLVDEGGSLCSHQTGNGSGYISHYDGRVVKTIHEKSYVEHHSNQYHIGCCNGSGRVEISGGSYIIQWSVYQQMNGGWARELDAVYITPQANLDFIVAAIIAGPWSFYEVKRKFVP